ncbi:hypothetical protein BDW68DRAFT_174655 [Aspergillus falconensis]
MGQEQTTESLICIVGAFLAFGFLHIKDSHSGGSWRYLFACEGLPTGVIGIIAAFWMPASPAQTKGGFRVENGWFTEHDEKIMLRSQGFTTFQTTLLTIPAAVVSITVMITTTWLAERTNQRLIFGAIVDVWYLVLLIALDTLPEKNMPWPRFAILTLIVGGPSVHPVLVALTSRDAGSVARELWRQRCIT